MKSGLRAETATQAHPLAVIPVMDSFSTLWTPGLARGRWREQAGGEGRSGHLGK